MKKLKKIFNKIQMQINKKNDLSNNYINMYIIINMNNLFYGILEINSKISYGVKNEKKFIPLYNNDNNIELLYVPTKKEFNVKPIYCVVKYSHYNSNTKRHYGLIEQYIGEIGEYENEILFIKTILINNWKNNKKFKNYDINIDLTPDRIDLTHLNTFSIDPNNCIDIDDAFSFTKLNNNNFIIYIHIADVSSYIPPNSDLDIELQKRIQSIYLPNNNIHMIPDFISIDNISLLENKDNLRAFTLELNISKSNNIYLIDNYKYYKSKIKIKNYNYDYFDKKKISKYEDFINIAKYFYFKKFNNNLNINFNSHHLVEIMMIIANSISAKEIYDDNKSIFRAHNINITLSDNLYNKYSISNYLIPALYCMKNTTDLSHSVLTEDLYTHFTSPIRRYVDIIVHRILSNKYCNTKFEISYNLDTINKINKLNKKLSNISNLYNLFFNKDIGNIFSGNIIGFHDNYIIVYIRNIGIVYTKIFDKIFSNFYECKLDKINNIYSIKNTNDRDRNINYIFKLDQLININIHFSKISYKKILASVI